MFKTGLMVVGFAAAGTLLALTVITTQIVATATTLTTNTHTHTPNNTSRITPQPVGDGTTVTVAGFTVAASIGPNVARLVTDATAAGHTLGGWAFRSHAAQIRLRKAHCGTSDYAIYRMPSSQCRPPTATPGNSMHETGLAIDFTCGGRRFYGTACWDWFRVNIRLDPGTCQPSPTGHLFNDRANCYGLYNLPSEPWHWSTNGR